MQLPESPLLKLIVQRYAEVVDALDLTPGEQPLVLPTGEWFPDKFTGDQGSFEVLVARMQGYAGLEDAPIDAVLVGAAEVGSCGTGGCGTGACGPAKPAAEGPRLVELEHGYRLEMPATAVSHPIAFTASVARLLGHLRLVRSGRANTDVAGAELSAMALGFGVLMLEASYLYSKSCGGPSVGSATALSCGELAVPLALFFAYEGHKPRAALAELSTTQRAVMDEAITLVESNRALVERLRKEPGSLKDGAFKLSEAKSWLARLFSGSRKRGSRDLEALALEALERGESVDTVAALLHETPPKAATRSTKTSDKDDDLGALVDEALTELRGASPSAPANR